ncbi:MAG: tRNA (adenosine(37)-N6)-dimethylallyltransferase MiaA [Alphaproteobacteria bacterium]|nr:tRNA (adenosine(37)-N6)-dimethylallyltransferase MiaA [Alphaproteobacteria bacterium]
MKIQDYVIVGPTASGKSGFAHALAKKINGVIINCDSVQVYRGIENISASPFAGLTDKIDVKELDGVPYKLFSVLNLSEQQSVCEYLDMARAEYNDAHLAGRPVVVVGGTGYYVNALLNGISEMPTVSPENRARARELVATNRDAAIAMLPDDFTATDPQRIARALEIYFETGHHITEFQRNKRVGAVLPHDTVKILINPDADILRERIASRIPEMLSGGAIDEGRAIIASGWNPERAIGASQVVAYLRGDCTYDTMIQNWISRTNQYAKRQRTWFRHQYNADIVIDHVPTDDDIDKVLNQAN